MMWWMGRRGPQRGPNASKALALRLRGLSYTDIGRTLGISRQRAQQITSPPTPIRRAVVARAKGRCESCDVPVGSSGPVHHRGADDLTPDEYSDLENLQLLCLVCHAKAHGPPPMCYFSREPELCVGDDGSYHCPKHSKRRLKALAELEIP